MTKDVYHVYNPHWCHQTFPFRPGVLMKSDKEMLSEHTRTNASTPPMNT